MPDILSETRIFIIIINVRQLQDQQTAYYLKIIFDPVMNFF